MNRILASTLVGAAALAAACRPSTRPSPVAATAAPRLVPLPASMTQTRGEWFTITDATTLVADTTNADVRRVAAWLAALLRPSTGFPLAIVPDTGVPAAGRVVLRLGAPAGAGLGAEGYQLVATRDSVRILASGPAGLFYGVQTLRQLLPAGIESHMTLRSGVWAVPVVSITDQPRFAWRGAMLDVARHFFTVDEVKQYIDLLALYKLNTLHLHLSDDQGWRIEITSRPRLTELGSVTQVGGGPGGYYTQAEFGDIVRYARDRFITIVPEIDMPAHINAALISHPELSCGERPPAPYTGIEVGFSAICPDKEESYALLDDVIREIAAITPGPYFHVGGDEVRVLKHDAYVGFIERVQNIVSKYGKQMVGWEEIARAQLRPTTLVQQWATDTVAVQALKYGAKVIMSPGRRMYIDMKYTPATELGLNWAGLIEVRDAYDWDPSTFGAGVTERDIVGMEAPMWSETLRNITAVEFLAVPRLPALAEVAWTPQAMRDWGRFRERLAAQAPRWNYLGINYYRSPQIPW